MNDPGLQRLSGEQVASLAPQICLLCRAYMLDMMTTSANPCYIYIYTHIILPHFFGGIYIYIYDPKPTFFFSGSFSASKSEKTNIRALNLDVKLLEVHARISWRTTRRFLEDLYT